MSRWGRSQWFQMMKSVPWGSPSISGLQVGGVAMEQLNSRIFWQIAFGLLRRFGNSHRTTHPFQTYCMLGTYLLVLSLLTTCLGIVYIKSCCVVELRRNKRNQIWLKMVMCRDRQHFPLKDMFFPLNWRQCNHVSILPACLKYGGGYHIEIKITKLQFHPTNLKTKNSAKSWVC